MLGVNLIYGAFFRRKDPVDLIASLMDELSRERVELDMIKLSGPAFPGLDNRLLSLQLVEQGLTDAAMFTASGEVVQPSEVLARIQRGDPSWEQMVPAAVAEIIKAENLFGWQRLSKTSPAE